MRECKGYYQAELNEMIWKCECGIKGPWACNEFINDHEKNKAEQQAKYDMEVLRQMECGRVIFRQGLPPSACRLKNMEASLTTKSEPCENIDRLIGYIDEMRKI